MRVFISSVRRGLQAERDYLPGLIRAVGHEPSRFEDFGAKDATSREACQVGVQQADVYILLLGPHYGDEMADSGVSATEEEFTVAQQRGMPTLVFRKVGIEYDDDQQAFMARLGKYQEGRFWAEFDNNESLGILVAKALTELALPAPPLTLLPLTHPVEVRWRSERQRLTDEHTQYPVLEVHALPADVESLLPVSRLADLADQLASRGREMGFFGQGDAVTIDYDSDNAWAVRQSEQQHGRIRTGYGERMTDAYSGLAVGRDGSAMIFQSLPADMLGALVNHDDLQQRLTVMLRIIAPHVRASEHIALAAAIDPLDRVAEGDPLDVGNRNTGQMTFHNGASAKAAPADQVPRASLTNATGELAGELAVRLMHEVRTARRHDGGGWA